MSWPVTVLFTTEADGGDTACDIALILAQGAWVAQRPHYLYLLADWFRLQVAKLDYRYIICSLQQLPGLLVA